jgi:hypothetical protein
MSMPTGTEEALYTKPVNESEIWLALQFLPEGCLHRGFLEKRINFMGVVIYRKMLAGNQAEACDYCQISSVCESKVTGVRKF